MVVDEQRFCGCVRILIRRGTLANMMAGCLGGSPSDPSSLDGPCLESSHTFSEKERLGAERADGWAIGCRGQAQGARGQRNYRHGIAGHVEEHDRVAFLAELTAKD